MTESKSSVPDEASESNPVKKLAIRLAKSILEQELPLNSISSIKGHAEAEGIIGVTKETAALAKGYIRREYQRRIDEQEDEPKKRPPTIATQIVNMALDSDILFFRDKAQQAYAKLKVDDHWEIWPIVRSKRFNELLIYRHREATGSVPNSNAVRDATMALSAHAIQEGPVYPLFNRVARFENAIWFDLTNENWEVVRIDANGWEILPVTPVPMFRRWDCQSSQVTPTKTHYGKRAARHRRAKMLKLKRFHNLKNEKDRILDEVSLIFALVPHVPHPPTLVSGPAGSGKTLGYHRTRVLLYDPSTIEHGLSWPKKSGDIPLQFERHYALIYSNLSWLSREMSDYLCRVVDGDSFETRKLYKDDEMITFRYQRCVGINSIPLVATQEDLIDRSLLFELGAIAAEDRLDEEELKRLFETVRPVIFGAMLDTLSAAMKIRPTIKLGYIERMGSFTKWGCAIAEALGYTHEDFLDAYSVNRKTANEEVVLSNILSRVTMEFMRERLSWDGTPKQLYETLMEFEFGKRKIPKSWPKDAARMSKRYSRIAQPLYRSGLIVKRGTSGSDRYVSLTWREGYGPVDVQERLGGFPDSTDNADSDSLLTTSTINKKDKKREEEVKKRKTTVGTVVLSETKKPKKKPKEKRVSSRAESKKKTLPRIAKQFDRWVSKLPNAGWRGFTEPEIQRAYGNDYYAEFSKYVEKKWIEQRGKKKLNWWISKKGETVLKGDAVK